MNQRLALVVQDARKRARSLANVLDPGQQLNLLEKAAVTTENANEGLVLSAISSRIKDDEQKQRAARSGSLPGSASVLELKAQKTRTVFSDCGKECRSWKDLV